MAPTLTGRSPFAYLWTIIHYNQLTVQFLPKNQT